MWFEHERDFLQRFATAYIENCLSKSLEIVVERVVMFDRAKLSTTYLLAIFFNIILNSRHDINMIQQITDLVYHCNNNPINYLASNELDTQCKKLFHSQNFKNAFITAIFHEIEKENVTQDEMNTYEVALRY